MRDEDNDGEEHRSHHGRYVERREYDGFRRHMAAVLAKLQRETQILQREIIALKPHHVRIHLTVGGIMPGAITVDTTNETATLDFVDDKGNKTDAPSGATFAYSSDNEAVVTVAADPANPYQADISPTGLGTANISATSNGSAVDGSGAAIADPSSVQVTVSAGAAAGESFSLSV